MSRAIPTAITLAALVALAGRVSTTRGQDKPKELKWTHAFDLACRKFGEDKFGKDTQKFGVEIFKDNNTGLGLYVSQTGSLALAPGFQAVQPPIKDSKGPVWLTGLDLPARKAGEKKFSKETKVNSLEVFRDPNVENWVLVTEKGNLAVTPAKTKPDSANSSPKWLHSFDLSCRKGGVKDWKDARKVGVEVYRDGNTGNLIYISETGAIAAIPEGAPAKGEAKAPAWLHGLDLSCRSASEPAFTKQTRKFGVEVFRDDVTGNLVFICETGALAVAPAPKDLKAPTANVKEPNWTHGLNVKVRTFGEKDFSDKTKVYGAEVFRDENVGTFLYICETGSISAAPAK
jgi:hypothetical protein